MKPPDEIRREGDDFIFSWGNGLEAEVRDLHASGRGPTAEVCFRDRLQGHLHQAMLNLMSSSSRDTFRRALDRRDDEPDWQLYVEQVCVMSVQKWREGEPFQRLPAKLRDEDDAHLIHPMFPRLNGGATLLFGDGASGKSSLVQLVAVSLERGDGLAAMRGAGPLRVGYLDWETDEEEFADRMARVDAEGCEPFYKRLWAPLPGTQRQIKREADALGLEVCIYDSLGFAAGGELKDPDVVLQCFAAIRYIGRPGILVHHIPKENKEPFGSVYVRNAARNAWYLAKSTENDDGFSAVAIHRKSNRTKLLDAVGLRFRFSPTRMWLERTDAKPMLLSESEGSVSERVMALLAEHGGWLTPDEVGKALKFKNSDKVRKPMQRGYERGELERRPDGSYRLCDMSRDTSQRPERDSRSTDPPLGGSDMSHDGDTEGVTENGDGGCDEATGGAP